MPTAVQQGYPSLALDGLVGVFGPRVMSDDLRKKIAADVVEAAKDPQFVARLSPTGQLVSPGDSAQFAKEIADQSARVQAAAKAAGVEPPKP